MMFFYLCINFFAPSEAAIENVDYFVCMTYVLTGIQVSISNKLFLFSEWLWETLLHVFCIFSVVVYKNSLKQKIWNDWGFAEFYHNHDSCRVFLQTLVYIWKYDNNQPQATSFAGISFFLRKYFFINDGKAEVQAVSKYTISWNQFFMFWSSLLLSKRFLNTIFTQILCKLNLGDS